METERKMYINEDHLLNSPGATKIYLNTGKSRKVNAPNDGTVIHLNTDKQTDLGVYFNATSSKESSKKLRLLFLLNFLLSLACMVICFSVAGFYWHELSGLQRQIDLMKEHLVIQTLHQEKIEQSALVRHPTPREGISGAPSEDEASENTKLFIKDIGEDQQLDSKRKNGSDPKHTTTYIATMQKDLLIAHFNGAYNERNIGDEYLIGPWKHDEEISSKNSNEKIALDQEQEIVLIKESGLYLIYAQVAYLSHSPNMYTIWATRSGTKVKSRLSICGTGDDSTRRTLGRAQISCAVQTVARLRAGDTVKVSQRDANRTLLLQPGYSYFGFVKIAP